MARTTLKGKTSLVLGADSPVGRAISLQLSREGSRVVLAGFDPQKLGLLYELLRAKGGEAFRAFLSDDAERSIVALKESRDNLGNHFHFIVNALAATEGPSDDPGLGARRAVVAGEFLVQLTEGKGSLRQLTIWPDEAGTPPNMEVGTWHSLVRINRLESEHDEATATPDSTVVRAAGAADTVICILSCPPSACPVEVRLAPRELKA